MYGEEKFPEENYDIEKLREELIDYYGSGSFFFPMMMGAVIDIESASPKRILELAREAKLI